MIVFNNLEGMQPYYNKNTRTYQSRAIEKTQNISV